MEFIRYGSLVPQKHNEHCGECHEAPVEYGIYAFPIHYVEEFLLGGVGSGNLQNGRYKILRYKNGKKIKLRVDEICNINEDCHWSKSLDYKDEFINIIKENYPDVKPEDINIYSEELNKFIYLYRDILEDKPILKEKPLTFCISRKPNIFNHKGLIWSHLSIFGNKIINPGDIIQIKGDWILTDIKTYERGFKKYINKLNYEFRLCKDRTGRASKKLYDKDWLEVFIEKIE